MVKLVMVPYMILNPMQKSIKKEQKRPSLHTPLGSSLPWDEVGGRMDNDDGKLRKGRLIGCPSRKQKQGGRRIREPPTGEGEKSVRLGRHTHVDLAVVPRKPRSAIKKHNKSLFPPSSEAQKSNHLTSSPNGQTLMNDMVSKDEVQVIEALSCLAGMAFSNDIVEIGEDNRMSHGNSKAEATAISKVDEVKIKETMNTCDVVEQRRLSSNVESLKEETRKETSASERVITYSETHTGEQEPEQNSLRACSEVMPINGRQESKKLGACPISKIDLGKQPFDLSCVNNELCQDKQKSVGDLFIYKKGDTNSVSSHAHGKSGMIHSRRHTPGAETFASAVLNKNDQKTEQGTVISGSKSRPWANCLTHVYISRFTQSYQFLGKVNLLHLYNPLKVKGTDVGMEKGKGVIGRTNGFDSTNFVDLKGKGKKAGVRKIARGMIGRTNGLDRSLPSQQIPTPPKPFTQLNRTYNNFLALYSNGEISNPGKELNLSGHLSVPCMHPLIHHHAGIPFPFPPDSPYPDIAHVDVNKQAIRLQLPPYPGSQYYPQHMLDGRTTCFPYYPQMWWPPMTSWNPLASEHKDSFPSSLPSTTARAEAAGNSRAYFHTFPQQQKPSLSLFQSSPSLQSHHQSNISD